MDDTASTNQDETVKDIEVTDSKNDDDLLKELIGEYQYVKEDAPEGILIIKEAEYTPGSIDVSDYTQGESYRFLSSGSDVEKVAGDSVYIKYPETVNADGEATFTYYILKKTDDGVDVLYSSESFDKAEVIYRAVKQ